MYSIRKNLTTGGWHAYKEDSAKAFIGPFGSPWQVYDQLTLVYQIPKDKISLPENFE